MATAVTWYLSINGTSKSLTAWDAKSVTLAKKSLAADELTFSIPVRDIMSPPAINYGDVVILMRGTEYAFIGTVLYVSSNFGSEEERLGVTCVNAWWKFERILYKQKHVVNMGTPTAPSYIMTEGTKVILGQDVWGNKQTTAAQIIQIGGFAAVAASGMSIAPSLRGDLIPPWTEARDITCSQALMRMIEYTPDSGAYMDYSTGNQILFLKQRAYMDIVPINLDGTLVVNVDGLKKRQDMVPAGVVFTFITARRDPATDQLIPVETVQSSGNPSGVGVIAATIELALAGSTQAEQIPVNLSSLYYNALQVPCWEGTIQLKERECSITYKPGTRINLGFGRAEWASMYAIVTAVTHELDTGVTNIELGLPNYLSGSGFLDLMTRFRQSTPAGDFAGTKHNGDAGVPTGSGGDGSKPGGTGLPNASAGQASGNMVSGNSFPMDTCQGGNTLTKIVRGG